MYQSALPHVISQVLKCNLKNYSLICCCCYCLLQKLSFVTKMCLAHMCYLQLIFFHCLNKVKKCIFCFRSYALLNITDYRLETAAATIVEAILGLLKCKSTHINFTACINVDHDIVR